MPKLTKADRDRLPSTLARSDEHAQAIYIESLKSAEASRGDGEYAHRVAFGAVKHSYEKVGDHWEPKAEKGASDRRAEIGGASQRGASHGGVDANATKEHLLDLARKADVHGRSRMTKSELVDALEHANARATAAARS